MQQSPVSRSTALIPEAVRVAQESDVVVACVGDLAGLFQSGTVGEGSDTDSLNLPGVQQQLLEALVATGKPVVVVMTGEGRTTCKAWRTRSRHLCWPGHPDRRAAGRLPMY
jgi:beta-glucosidase